MTCAHCEELREEIRFLKRELCVESEQGLIDRLQAHFHCPAGEARVLAALYAAKGRYLTVLHLDGLLPVFRTIANQRDLKHVSIRIYRLRQRLGAASIRTMAGRGYGLTDLGRLQVEEALEGQQARAA